MFSAWRHHASNKEIMDANDISSVYSDVKESIKNKNIVFCKSILIDDQMLEICSTFELSNEINIFFLELEQFIKNISSKGNAEQRFKYSIDDDLEISGSLDNMFHHNFVTPDDKLLGSLPTYGGVILKISKCRKYLMVNWNQSALFFYRIGDDEAYIYCLNKNKKFDSMVKYFVMTPYIYLGKLLIIHGGTVNYQGINYMITNESNKGKTTFTLLFWSKGATVFTEDMTYADNHGNFLKIPVRDHFNLRFGTLKIFAGHFPELADLLPTNNQDELYEMGMDKEIQVDIGRLKRDPGDDRYISSNKIDVVVIPNINPEIKGYKVSKIDLQMFLEINKDNIIYDSPTVQWFSYVFPKAESTNSKDNFINAFKNKRFYTIETDFEYMDHFDKFINEI
jgi:hypothetical protein